MRIPIIKINAQLNFSDLATSMPWFEKLFGCGFDVFESYRTTCRGVEAMDNSYRLLDLTVYGRQEDWED